MPTFPGYDGFGEPSDKIGKIGLPNFSPLPGTRDGNAKGL